MSSNWVKTEIANARERETQEGKQLLFPITLVPFEAIKPWKLFDAAIGIDSARETREYFIPDFSNWKDRDSYQTAFQGLGSLPNSSNCNKPGAYGLAHQGAWPLESLFASNKELEARKWRL